MSLISFPKALVLTGTALILLTPGVANAYMGPGLGLGFLGAVFGVIGSVLLGIAAIVWYPIKRLLRRLRALRNAKSSAIKEQAPEA